MKQFSRCLRGISPVLAVLMMIAVAIAGALVTYAWVMGYIGFQTQKSGEAIQINSVANDGDNLLVYVQNVGETVVQLDEDGCLYVNGVLVPCDISNVSVSQGVATLGLGETATLRYVGGAASPGERVDVKVTTLLGAPSELSDYPAGRVREPPVLDRFEFSYIPSPQKSGVPVNFTVRALDQYGDVFTSYTDNCSMWGLPSAQKVSNFRGEFVSGVGEFSILLEGTATDTTIFIAAGSGLSCRGTSNPFDVVLPEET